MVVVRLALVVLMILGCDDRTSRPNRGEGSMGKTSDEMPTLASKLAGVTRVRIRRVPAVEPPFPFEKGDVSITDPTDIAILIRAIGIDQPATSGGPRCLTAFVAELFAADEARGMLNLFCASGTASPVAIIRDQDPARSWTFADGAAAQALLRRVGN
jgi:hypothetical protein